MIGGLLPDLLGQPGLATVVADAAGPAVSALVAGQDITTVVDALITTLRSSTVIQDDLGAFTTETVTALLGDTTLWTALGKQLAELVDTIASNPDVQAYAGEFAARFVTETLSASFPADFAAAIGTAIGDAVTSLLEIPAFTAGLGAVVGIVIPTLLEQPGLVGAVAAVAGQLVTGVVAGADIADAVGEAITALETDPVVREAIGATISAALNVVEFVILDNRGFQQGLGAIITTFTEQILDSPAVLTYIVETLGEPLAGFATALLTDTAFTGRVAETLGATVTNFLAFPDFNAALVSALNLAVDEVLSGAEVSAAVADALASLQADPGFQAAVYGVVPMTVAMLLGDPAVRQAISSALPILVSAILKDAGITNGIVDALVGRIAGQATAYLLAQVPVWDLVDTVAEDLIIGKIGLTSDDIIGLVLDQLRTQPGLQIAVGMGLGAGIGLGIFGENPVGIFVFLVTGATAAVGVVAAAALWNIYLVVAELLRGEVPGFLTPMPAAAQVAESNFLQASVASDFYVMNAIVPNWRDGDVVHPAASGSQLGLTDLTVDVPEAASDRINVSMTFDVTESQNGPASIAPLMLDLSFPVDRLFPALVPAGAAASQARRRQSV